MNITIQAINLELTAAIKTRAEEKMRGLAKYIHTNDVAAAVVDIEVGKTTAHHHKGQIFFCEAHLRVPGKATIRAREEDEDLYAAIDEVHDELQRQLIDLKKKRLARRRSQ